MAQKKVKPAKAVAPDVAPPDTTEPDSSAKPIIVTHRPLVKDPMVNANPASQKPEPGTATSTDTTELPPGLKSPSQSRKIIAPTSAEAAEVMAASNPLAKTESEAHETEHSDDDALAVDGLAKADKRRDAKLQAEHQLAVDKLVENRTYYLPINQVEKRRNKRYTILGLFFILVLAVAWLDVSLDSGILTINGIKAPTHFFH